MTTNDQAARLPHCTPTFGGHSPLCDRDGTYCSRESTHSGACSPHGSLLDLTPPRQSDFGRRAGGGYKPERPY